MSPSLLAVATGLLLGLASPGYDLSFFAWLAWVPLFRAIDGEGPRRAAWLGAVAGATCTAATLSWVGVMLAAHAGLGLFAAAGATFLAGAAYSLPYGVYAGALAFHARRRGRFPVALAILLWPALEWTRTLGPLAAPWNLLGYDLPAWSVAAQTAEWTGVYGVGATIVAVNAALHVATSEPPVASRKRLVATTAVVVATFAAGYGLQRASSPGGATVRIGIVQPGAADGFSRAAELSKRAASEGAEVIVWPEASVPGAIVVDADVPVGAVEDEAPAAGRPGLVRVAAVAAEIGRPIVLPVEGVASEPVGHGDLLTSRNRVVRVDPDGTVGALYDKRRLVPFGEILPPGTTGLGFEPPAQGERPLRPGPATSEPFDLGPAPAAMLVCWEAIFPSLVARTAEGAALLVDVTNDDWLIARLAFEQHFAMAALRAVETRRPLVRVARSGISAVVDPDGVVRERAAIGASTFRVVEVATATGSTFYTRHGDLFAIGAGLASLGLLVYAGGSRRRPSGDP